MTSVICFALRARPPVSVMRREIVMTGSWFKIRQLTDVCHCNLEHCFPRNGLCNLQRHYSSNRY